MAEDKTYSVLFLIRFLCGIDAVMRVGAEYDVYA